MKKLLLSAIMLLGSIIAEAQTANQAGIEMAKNLNKYVRYPDSLIEKMVPTITSIKFDVDARGAITGIDMSDSGPALLKTQFGFNKSKFILIKLKAFIANKGLKSCSIILPVYFLVAQDDGTTVSKSIEKSIDQFIYNGKHLDQLAYNLAPVITVAYQPQYKKHNSY